MRRADGIGPPEPAEQPPAVLGGDCFRPSPPDRDLERGDVVPVEVVRRPQALLGASPRLLDRGQIRRAGGPGFDKGGMLGD